MIVRYDDKDGYTKLWLTDDETKKLIGLMDFISTEELSNESTKFAKNLLRLFKCL